VDIVLGVSMAPTTVRLVVIEGQNADGVTVEQDEFEVASEVGEAGDSVAAGAVEQVIAAIGGTREGAVESGHRLSSTGVTWTDPAGVGALRDAIGSRDVGSVMLVSPLLAAAALAQTVGYALDYEQIAMLFVEPRSATLAVVDIADGSIVDLQRHQVAREGAAPEAVAAELAAMVAGLDARESWADGVFLVGCGTDIVAVKPALEAVTSLEVTAPEEPDMALARGAALASANAPLFASSTAALAYALDPGTGELNPPALSPTYLDVYGNARLGALAYSAVEDDEEIPRRRRRSSLLAGAALVSLSAVVAGALVVSLAADRPTSAVRHQPRVGVATPVHQLPAQAPSKRPEAQLPAPPPPASPAPPKPTTQVAAPAPAPPPPEQPAPHTTVKASPPAPVYHQPAPRYVPTPVQRAVPAPAPAAPAPAAPPPAAPPPAAPPPPPAAPAQPRKPLTTVTLHLPFVTVPIPIYPPPPPPPPPPPQ